MVPEVYVGPISQNNISQFFFLILEWISDISVEKVMRYEELKYLMRQGQWYGTKSIRVSDFAELFFAIFLSNSAVN